MIYNPEEDSYLLAGCVSKMARGLRVLDMGSGSGIQARMALDSGAKKVVCVDIDEEVVKHLKKEGFDVVQSDLFGKVSGKFDMIVFNPPYLPADKREDAESSRVTSGGKEGDEIIVRFLRNVKKFLRRKGFILLLVSSLTPRDRIEAVLISEGLDWDVVSSKKVFMERLEVWKIS